MTIEYARELATEYAEEKQIEYMEQVDLRDPAEMFASQQVYEEAYNLRLNQLIERYNLTI